MRLGGGAAAGGAAAGGGGAAAGGGGAAAHEDFDAIPKPLSGVNWSDGERAYHAAIYAWSEVQDGPVPLLPVSLYRSPNLRSTCGSGSGGGGGAADDDHRISFNKEVTVFSKPTPLLGAILEEKADLKGSSGGGRPGGAGHGSFKEDADGAATPRN